jgi:hypothetical protein
MSKLVIDDLTRAALLNLGDHVQLVSTGGDRLGFFVTPATYLGLLAAAIRLEFPPGDPAARERFTAQQGGAAGPQLLDLLRRLDGQEEPPAR